MAQAKRWYRLPPLWLAFRPRFTGKFRHEAKKNRILDYTPTHMQPVEPNPSVGMALSHKRITVEVPWSDLNVDKSKVVGTWAIFAFDSGLVVTMCTPSPSTGDIRSSVEKEFGGPEAVQAEAFARLRRRRRGFPRGRAGSSVRMRG
jgi:hypothetical protein